VELASKLWPIAHRRYEEMCALAVTGQLTGPQMCELNEHVTTCVSCRDFVESSAQVSVQAMSLLADLHAPATEIVAPEGMRARFLSRLAREENANDGLAPPPFLVPVDQALIAAVPERREREVQQISASNASLASFFSYIFWRRAAALAACAVVGIAGFYAGTRASFKTASPLQDQRQSSEPVSLDSGSSSVSDRVAQLERQKKELEAQLGEDLARLTAAGAQAKALGNQLADANTKLAEFTAQTQDEQRRRAQEDRQAQGRMADLLAELGRLRGQLDESKVTLGAHQLETEELRAKLEQTDASLRRELDLKSAKSELGDLVAARNLHIVDVYDADPSGKRQRSFGRVFYIEGRSLVFYAYDLDDPGQFRTSVVFHVWGGKAGVKEVTHSLGILHRDDGGQGRWAMTFDDPRVLAQINTVFVTAEAGNQHLDAPHGKKVLYAYFGSPPNHP
jgi:predicted  nucleic acid-binding Zn-ribbon protein